ncbi:helicase-related protein [Nocardia thailandica]
MSDELVEQIAALLLTLPDQSAPQIAAALNDPAIDRTVVNRVLYTERARFVVDASGNPPRWSLRERKSAVTAKVRSAAARPVDRLEPASWPPLRSWQQRALAAWTDNGRKGIIEAVGGTGKSALGMRVVVEAMTAGTPAVVIVADDAARAIWLSRLAEMAPGHRVVGPGGEARPNTERTWQVAILTPATANRLRQIAPPTQCSDALLVVDDLDRHSAGVFAHALTDQFTARLGLSRAVDRGNQTVRTQLVPYFGPLFVAGCDYATARAERLLDPVTLVQVGVQLDARERASLDRANALVERQYDTLTGSYGAPESAAEFRAFVDALAAGRGSGAHHANRYLTAVSDRATILAECRAKAEVLELLPTDVLAGTQTIVFADRPVAAGRVHQLLADRGIPAATTSAALTPAQRSAIADRLADRSLKVLVEQRILEPALAVPDAGIALVLARSRDSTQLIHRLGRVVRSSAPRRPRLVIVLFVIGSPEDPAHDADATAAIRPLAAETVRTDPAGLITLLEQWHRTAPRDNSAVTEALVPEPATADPVPADADDAAAAAAPAPESAVADVDVAEPAADVAGADELAAAVLRSGTVETPEVYPASADEGGRDDHTEPGIYTDFLAELMKLGGIGTAEEIGDVVGCCDPVELRELAETAACAGDLVFHDIGGDSEDLLLLSTAPHTDHADLVRYSGNIAAWAVSSEDPIGGMYQLMADLAGLPIPSYRLIQLAAFLRGTTPHGLL